MKNDNDAERAASISRRTVMKGAAWSVPVVAVAVATPLAAASTGPEPTDIGVTLQPTPAQAGVPTRLTYFGTAGFDPAQFPAGSTATITVTGAFTDVSLSGISIVSDSGSDPRVIVATVTNLASFYLQGTAAPGASVSTTVYDGGGTEIGSDLTNFPGEPD